MRRFGVTVAAAILIAATAIPAGAGSLYSSGNAETAQNLVPVSHRSGDWHRDRDCHRQPVRHFIPGYGRVLHDHDGRRCRVDVMRRADRRDRGDCIRIGDVKICV